AGRREKKILRATRNIAIADIFVNLGATLTFTMEELSDAAQIPLGVASAYPRARSVEFGSTNERFTRPSPTPSLMQKPFVHHDGRYMVPAPVWLAWGLRSFLEDNLNADKPNAINRDKILWNRYDRARAEYLETTAIRYLGDAFGHATVYRK